MRGWLVVVGGGAVAAEGAADLGDAGAPGVAFELGALAGEGVEAEAGVGQAGWWGRGPSLTAARAWPLVREWLRVRSSNSVTAGGWGAGGVRPGGLSGLARALASGTGAGAASGCGG